MTATVRTPEAESSLPDHPVVLLARYALGAARLARVVSVRPCLDCTDGVAKCLKAGANAVTPLVTLIRSAETPKHSRFADASLLDAPPHYPYTALAGDGDHYASAWELRRLKKLSAVTLLAELSVPDAAWKDEQTAERALREAYVDWLQEATGRTNLDSVTPQLGELLPYAVTVAAE